MQTGAAESVHAELHQAWRPVDFRFARACVEDAQSAITALWEPNGRTFWRSTSQRDREVARESEPVLYPTVTLKCVDTLLYLLAYEPTWLSGSTRTSLRDTYVPAVLEIGWKDLLSSSMKDEAGVPNIYTASIYIETLSRVVSAGVLATEPAGQSAKRLLGALHELLSHHALIPESLPGLHPFLAYHVRRALLVGLPLLPDNGQCVDLVGRLEQHARQSIFGNLAKHAVGSLNPSEAVALAFCAASLVRPAGRSDVAEIQREDKRLVSSALRVCFGSQDPHGCWPLGRVIEENKDISTQRLEITTFEVAAAVAEVAGSLLRSSDPEVDESIVSECLDRLLLSGRYGERSVVRMPQGKLPRAGWCSDHAYGAQMIESWTSATVIDAFVGLSQLSREVARSRVLVQMGARRPGDKDWPSWLRWDSFRTNSEVDHRFPVLRYLDEKIVETIRHDPRGLPSTDARNVSALLFGPPGTSKTTIAKGVADGLGWPVILLSPGHFIERGLEYIEAQSRSVFDQLASLSRTVVVFDECDELFRDRKPRPESEQVRGITAFVTASMLPKLQELHDRAQVIFFICTNNFGSMDPAIKRGGRVDHILGIGPPDKEARRRLASEAVAAYQKKASCRDLAKVRFFSEAISELVEQTERFTRSELERVTKALAAAATTSRWRTDTSARTSANNLVREHQTGLTITKEEFDHFFEDNQRYSHSKLLREG